MFVNYLKISLAALLFSFVGLFGKTIALPASQITAGRALFAFLIFALWSLLSKLDLKISKKIHLLQFSILGILLAGNWYFYFLAIKVSTVSIAVVSLFTYPFLTSILEPILHKKRINVFESISGIFIILGIAIMVPEFSLSNNAFLGIIWGCLSGLCFSLCTIYTRTYMQDQPVVKLLFYQYLVILILFIPRALLSSPLIISWNSIFQLILLGGVFTTLSQLFFIDTLKKVTASVATIILSMQPILTILFAFILLNEKPEWKTILGATCICCVVVAIAIKPYLYKLNKARI